jgi:hypothetical protein
MKPDRILGWSVEKDAGRRSHVIGVADIVVGTTRPAIVTVSFSLCGTRGHGGSFDIEPSRTPCSRCLSVAFGLARNGELPAMQLATEAIQ